MLGIRTSRRAALPLLAATGLVFAAQAASAEPVSVVIDRAAILSVSRPASTVVVGNPAIADATMLDNMTLVITGRSFGTTNLIILDPDGKPIRDELVSVSLADNHGVTIHRRVGRQTFSCTPACAPMLSVGDDTTTFDAVDAQVRAKQQASSSAAAATPIR
jgi:Flp pilus assembly secretin CpaC